MTVTHLERARIALGELRRHDLETDVAKAARLAAEFDAVARDAINAAPPLYPFTLDWRFVREKSLLSDLIDRGTGGFFKVGPRWSHVGALTYDGKEFGARSGVDGAYTGDPGVQMRPGDYAVFVDQDIVKLPVTRAEFDKFWLLGHRIAGARYSKRTIEGFVTGDNIPDAPGSLAFDCSTLLAWLGLHCSAALMPAELRGELRQASPNSLYDIARTIRWYRRPGASGASA